VLSAGHARALLGLAGEGTDGAEAMERLAHRIVAEGLSVRAVEEIVALGGDESTPQKRRKTANRPSAPGLLDLADRVSERLETRVRVDMGRTKGKVVIEFASLDDLRRIVEVVDPEGQPPG
jgi:ParB family chromosome partitioning protein